MKFVIRAVRILPLTFVAITRHSLIFKSNVKPLSGLALFVCALSECESNILTSPILERIATSLLQ